MGLLFFLIFGLLIGLVARTLMPGDQKMGWVSTALLGVAGSFVGGFVASFFTPYRVTEFHTAGVIGSVIGAMLVLFVAGGLFTRRRSFV